MEIRIRETGQVVTEREFTAMAGASFGRVIDAATLNDFGADAVLEGAQPDAGQYQTVRRKTANQGIELVSGKWVKAYELADWTQGEIDAYNVAKLDATKKSLSAAVQSHLDAKAQERNYDNIVSACSYAGAANPFQAEGAAYITWRGDVWSACYSIMSDVTSGVRTVPTVAELIAELPALVLP